MGLPIVKYSPKGSEQRRWGILQKERIDTLSVDFPSHRELMACYFEDAEAFLAGVEQTALTPDQVDFRSPVSRDVQLFCQGLNYADHRAESGASTTGQDPNLFFAKAASSICGPNDTILRPRGCELLDYEIELALVLKRDITAATSISEGDLSRYVGALLLCNDVSARDEMFGAPMLQWFRGKSQRTFCPMGPVLYLADEEDFEQLAKLKLTLKLNDEVKQSATTDLLIHPPGETLTELSAFADMAAGDCLLTGTPGGILAGSSLKAGLAIIANLTNDARRRRKFTEAQLSRARFLEPGDRLELSIRSLDGAIDLGCQRNTIADA